MTALAKRLVASKGWRWIPGMKTSKGEIVLRVLKDRLEVVDGYVSGCIYPSLTDPGTLGHLLALVREAWGDPLICTAVDNTGYGWGMEGCPGTIYSTEAEALVAALEAAPCP